MLLDTEVAALYGVPTKALNQAAKRNSARFSRDFPSRLTIAELGAMNRSQFVPGSPKHQDLRHFPFAFTEHGALMAATVLNSARAVEMSVFIVRAFAHLRGRLESNPALARQLDELESEYRDHGDAIATILSAIRNLISEPPGKRRGIGFTAALEP